MAIETTNGAWSDGLHKFGMIWWLLKSLWLGQRNIRLITEFESWVLSIYQVGTGLTGVDSSKLRLLLISWKVSVCDK